jgi:hypothetical protein
MYCALSALSVGFKIWMAVDAGRRGMAYFWFFIIFFIPFGELIYFFVIKIDDYRIARFNPFRARTSLKQLEYNARTTPSIQNQLDLAYAHHDEGHYDRSRDLFAEVLGVRDDETAAQYGFARAAAKLGDSDAAIERLQQVLKVDWAHDDFEAVFLLADLKWHKQQIPEALELLARVERKSSRLSHQVRIAEFRVQTPDAAAEVERLSLALDDFRHAPWHVRKGQHGWAKRARRLIKVHRKKQGKP